MIAINDTQFPALSKYVSKLIRLVNETHIFTNATYIHGQYIHDYLTTPDGSKYSSTTLLFVGVLTGDSKCKSYLFRSKTPFRGENVINVALSAELQPVFQPHNIAAVALYRTGLHGYFKYPAETDTFRVAIRCVVRHTDCHDAASEINRIVTLNTLRSEDTKDITSIVFNIDDVPLFIEANQ